MHATDLTNASRTMLLDLDTLDWDDELLELFGVDRCCCPGSSARREVVGEAELLGVTLPIAGIAGDQQAALFGHGCFERGEAKATYGTGSFVLANAGAERGPPPSGLLETASPPRAATRSRARFSRAAPRSSGCATGSASSPTPRRARRWRASVESTGGV